MAVRDVQQMTRTELEEEVERLRLSEESDIEVRALIEQLTLQQEENRGQQQSLAESQRALEASRDRYATLFDFAPLGFVNLDSSGLIKEINLAAAMLVGGRERALLYNTPFVVFVDDPDRRIFLDQLMRCRRGTDLVRVEIRLKRSPVEAPPVELAMKLVRQDKSEIFYVVVTDLKERKALDEERLRGAIERERSRRESDAAQAASDAKDQFLAVLSHELRTPLTPILFGLAEIEGSGFVRGRVASVLEMIRRNVKIEAQLIDDLLDVTRIARGKLSLEMETVDLHEVLREVERICHSSDAAADRTISIALDAEPHHVWGDPTRLRQVFWNLLQNAIRYTGPRGHIRLQSESTPEGRLRVSVDDDGLGIATADLERIFEPFDQGGRKESRAGLGLGLTICKGLVDAHRGEIRALSEGRNRGARFEVELPITPVEVLVSGDSDDESQSGARPHSVLIVEDHVDTAEALAACLRGRGYHVRLAHSVREAARVGVAEFEVLVSDLQLPDGNGYELLAEFRRRGPIRAIAMSGFGSTEDQQRSREAGFNRHLVKPVSARAVLEAIEALAS
jgi:PAS domain S-box-containing protein